MKRRVTITKTRVLESLLVAVSLLLGFLVVEAGYRGYLYYTYAVKGAYEVVTIDTRTGASGFGIPGSIEGKYPPNIEFTRTQYDKDDRVVARHKVRVNNLGWVSWYDYSRTKEADEFRIAIVGDSMTESENNEVPWPDVLQRKPNADLELRAAVGGARFSVLNLGMSGASMQLMANPLAVIARRFSPDLLITNFVLDDIARRHSDSFETVPDEPKTPPPVSSWRMKIPPDLVVDGVEVILHCPYPPGKRPANALADPKCGVNPVWYVPPRRVIDGAELAKLKREVARRLLWSRVVLSLRPLALLELIGTPVIPRAQAAATETPTTLAQPAPIMRSGREDEDVDIALRALRLNQRLHPNHLVTHNPVFYYYPRDKRPVLLDRFLTLVAQEGFDIVEMEDYMPVPRSEIERNRWFNLPHDGHWSDHGADLYGEAMREVIRKRIIAERNAAPLANDNPCKASFERFRDARAALAKGDSTAAIAALSDAHTELPSDAINIARKHNSVFAYCGFLPDLYADRAALREARGEAGAAAGDWTLALELAADPAAVYQQRIASRRARGDQAGVAADFNALVALRPGNIDFLVQRGDMRLATGDAKGAVSDFVEGLKHQPKDLGLLFRLTQARMIAGDYAGVITDSDFALAINPRQTGILFTRANAHAGLKQWGSALKDMNALIEIVPNEPAFYEMRASIYDEFGREREAAADRARVKPK